MSFPPLHRDLPSPVLRRVVEAVSELFIKTSDRVFVFGICLHISGADPVPAEQRKYITVRYISQVRSIYFYPFYFLPKMFLELKEHFLMRDNTVYKHSAPFFPGLLGCNTL